MERLPFETLVVIVEYALPGPTLGELIPYRHKQLLTLSRISKQLRWVCLYLASLDVCIPSRAYYERWVSRLESLPRNHVLNTRCRSLEFPLELRDDESAWFEEHNLLRSEYWHVDPVPYFMGNLLTQKGLFPNLRAVHIHFGAYVMFDPHNFLFPACLPKSVNALYLHFYVSKYMIDCFRFGEHPCITTISRDTPVRFSCRKHSLEILDILVTGDEFPTNSGRHYTDVPIFRDIARLWGSLFDATPRLFIQGTQMSLGKASEPTISLSLNEAFEYYLRRQSLEEIGWNWDSRVYYPPWRLQNQKKKGIRRLVQTFVASKSFLKKLTRKGHLRRS